MAAAVPSRAGTVASLWRYPVKSMQGEEIRAADAGPGGLAGDRAYALQDRADGKIASAKNPGKWPNLFAFRAAWDERAGASARAIRITLPDGRVVRSDQGDIDRVLSAAVGRDVTLAARVADARSGTAEQYWADIEGQARRDEVTEFSLPAGTFFDGATVHLLTTATLRRLQAFYPQGRFDLRRFRPNIVVDADDGVAEGAWIGRTVAIGAEVLLAVTAPTGRCVMTTLPQGDLPRDVEILRTIVQHTRAQVGVYATVMHGGTIRTGDSVVVEEGRSSRAVEQ
jgi:hypothetical protein